MQTFFLFFLYSLFAALIIFIASVAFFAGNYFDNVNNSGRKYKLIALSIAFVSSWIITIFRYRKIDRDFKEIDQKIKEENKKSVKEGRHSARKVWGKPCSARRSSCVF